MATLLMNKGYLYVAIEFAASLKFSHVLFQVILEAGQLSYDQDSFVEDRLPDVANPRSLQLHQF